MKAIEKTTDTSQKLSDSAAFKTGLTTYGVGFGLSLALTIVAYGFVSGHVFSGLLLSSILAGLAIVQVLVQLLFFLHLRQEAEPRWKLLVFDFMLLIIAILVFGTLWIMNNLDYHDMTPGQTDTYIMKDEGIGR